MTTALLITTYNSPAYLRLVLESVAAQSVLPDEIIVADDGSGPETRATVKQFRPLWGERLKHVWQPDEGFQLSRIRNKGIAASWADYIIMVDGDTVLHPRFVQDHIAFARPGTLTAGLRAKLDAGISARLASGQARLPVSPLRAPMEGLRAYGLRMPWLTPLLKGHHSGSVRQLIGSNLAFWRSDALKVNGFEEGFTTWGEEDREFAVRLYNTGVKRRNMEFSGIQYHLYHTTRRDDDTIEANGRLLRQAMATGKIRADKGIDQWL